MNDKTLTKICLIITLIGTIALLMTYKPEFEETSIREILAKENTKGIINGRIDYVIKNYPITQFILTDGTKTLVYYPKPTTLKKNDFVEAYLENKPAEANTTKKQTPTLYAHKVTKK